MIPYLTQPSSYKYWRNGGHVPFYSKDMINSKRWVQTENVYMGDYILPSMKKIMSAHVCSYLCWSSMGTGDLEDRCYFVADNRKDIPYQHLCDFPAMPF